MAGKLQGKPGTSCAKQQGSNQITGGLEHKSLLKGAPIGLRWYNVNIKRIIYKMT